MIIIRKLTSDHVGRQFLRICICSDKICHLFSVPENSNFVADGHDLTHTVGDDNNSITFFFQIAENIEELCGLLRGKHTGRLVQDQKLYIPVQCF